MGLQVVKPSCPAAAPKVTVDSVRGGGTSAPARHPAGPVKKAATQVWETLESVVEKMEICTTECSTRVVAGQLASASEAALEKLGDLNSLLADRLETDKPCDKPTGIILTRMLTLFYSLFGGNKLSLPMICLPRDTCGTD